MPAELSLEGFSELLEKIEALGRKAARIENEALKTAAEPILEDAQSTTQFIDRSGDLRAGLKVSEVKTRAGVKYVLVGIDKSDNSKVFYGKFIEWGTSKMPAKPFLEPAFDRNKANSMEIMKKTFKEALGL
jgi:HK97 gp10 family phage protein